ncbi:MAG: glutamine amidotransferase family protein [Hyphomicrobiaceae bacterium]|nr:glutamine amidotransferase family protein [Hyphomicrobiaceae bacterium]
MCGIAGLYIKSEPLRPQLGALTALMLREMVERGPDSAGFAVYNRSNDGRSKITARADFDASRWRGIASEMSVASGLCVDVEVVGDHAKFTIDGSGEAARTWLIDNVPGATILAEGRSIEIYKGVGNPNDIAERFKLASFAGTHAIAHTRMATESAVTVAGSHPFSTGSDTCLVHNGSLSNHNRLRERLRRHGERFQTENDSEVAAAYLAWRMRSGDTLSQALEHSLADLDGFYTFVVGTLTGFAVLRDPVACKPAVMAETKNWVAFGSEFRALQPLPGIETARIWEPLPAKVYAWGIN